MAARLAVRTSATLLLAALNAPLHAEAPETLSGTLSLSGAWALYPMAVRWGEEFHKLHPGVQFDTSAGGAGKGMTDVLTGAVDVGLVSREVVEAEVAKGALPFAVAKDAVIPMVNARNPMLAELRSKGVKREALQGIWLTGEVKTWGQAAGTSDRTPIRVYTRSDACGAAQTWAAYFGKNQEDLKGIGVYGDPGLGEAVRRDAFGIGYNNVNYAYDAKTGVPVAGLAVLPLDVNGNGVLDPAENFYATQRELMDAISRGVFPSPPARDLSFVTTGTPTNPLAVAFLRWVLTDGQRFVEESGYIPVAKDRLEAGLAKLAPPAAR